MAVATVAAAAVLSRQVRRLQPPSHLRPRRTPPWTLTSAASSSCLVRVHEGDAAPAPRPASSASRCVPSCRRPTPGPPRLGSADSAAGRAQVPRLRPNPVSAARPRRLQPAPPPRVVPCCLALPCLVGSFSPPPLLPEREEDEGERASLLCSLTCLADPCAAPSPTPHGPAPLRSSHGRSPPIWAWPMLYRETLKFDYRRRVRLHDAPPCTTTTKRLDAPSTSTPDDRNILRNEYNYHRHVNVYFLYRRHKDFGFVKYLFEHVQLQTRMTTTRRPRAMH